MAETLELHLDGYDGPLHLLLDLARAQKVDLATISVLDLVEQFLACIDQARAVRLELAADWLVMAAWLAWLKSRLLLPPETQDAVEAELAADTLASRIEALAAARAAATWLADRPQLGHDVFARGTAEDLTETDRSDLRVSVSSLVGAYVNARRRALAKHAYTPARPPAYSVRDALDRLKVLVGGPPGWFALEHFLPQAPKDPRGALAATLVAALELARGGSIALRQDLAFAPIWVSPA